MNKEMLESVYFITIIGFVECLTRLHIPVVRATLKCMVSAKRAIVVLGFVVDAGQLCASCTDTEGRDTCQHYIECADEEVKLMQRLQLTVFSQSSCSICVHRICLHGG